MRKRRKAIGAVCLMAVCGALLFAGGGTMAAAKNCAIVGTWFGVGDSGITWVGIVSPGQSATLGQFTFEWVLIDPTLGGFFPTAVRVTPATGVWQKSSKQVYVYTWMAYGFDVNGALVYTARTSGTITFADCDHANITYVLEIWLADQNVSTDPPYFCAPGTATETRMPLVQATCPQ